jgi:hypothetical protein
VRFFFRIETVSDDEHDASLPATLRGAGGPADVGMAVAGALGQMEPNHELDIHVEKLTEQEE